VHPRILAQRESDASNRTVAAATKLAKRFGLEDQAKALKVEERRAEIQQLFRNEAVADFLETLVDTVAAGANAPNAPVAAAATEKPSPKANEKGA
jgi:hypothetical protein